MGFFTRNCGCSNFPKKSGFLLSKLINMLFWNRVVISSGNLTVDDWTLWSNCLFFHDFPLVSSKKESKEVSGTSEGQCATLLKRGVQEIMGTFIYENGVSEFCDLFNLDDYDFSGTPCIMTVVSKPGKWDGPRFSLFGLPAVANFMKSYPMKGPFDPKKLTVTYQSTSLGSIDDAYLKLFLASFIPQYATYENLKESQKAPKNNAKLDYSNKPTTSPVNNLKASKNFRIVFPTKNYVSNSEYKELAGCLFFKQNQLNDNWPKESLCKFECSPNYAFNEGVIPHLKVCIISREGSLIDDDSIIYFGSHNFTPSAWGSVNKDFNSNFIRNTEMGVIYPPMEGSAAKKREIVDSLPFKYPPEPYSPTDTPFFRD